MRAQRRVLVALHEEEARGASLSVLRAVPELRKLGWNLEFWVPAGSSLERRLIADGEVAHAAVRPFRYSRASWLEHPKLARRVSMTPPYFAELFVLLRRERYALVHGNSVNALPEMLVARLARRACIAHVHELLPRTRKGRMAGALLRHVPHKVVTVSQASRRRLAEAGVHAEVAYNGARILPTERKRHARTRLIIGTIGTISRTKGSDVFVELARTLLHETRNLEFRLVGAIPEGRGAAWARGVVQQAEDFGITHIPWTDVTRELAQWDLCVVPSREDAFPLAVLEAMAAGVAVLATQVGGIPEQLGGNAGRLVPPNRFDALVEAARDLILDAPARMSLAGAGRCRVNMAFTLARQAAALDMAYAATIRSWATNNRMRTHI